MVRPGTPVVYGFASTVSDMKNMQVSNANPGFLKEAKYGALMAKKYGLPCRSGGGMSDASGLTAQAGVESAMSMFESFTERANLMMHATGSLHSFNTVSFEKFLLDIETYTRMKYYFDDMPIDEDALAFDAIKEAIEEENGTFVTLDHTLRDATSILGTARFPSTAIPKEIPIRCCISLSRRESISCWRSMNARLFRKKREKRWMISCVALA